MFPLAQVGYLRKYLHTCALLQVLAHLSKYCSLATCESTCTLLCTSTCAPAYLHTYANTCTPAYMSNYTLALLCKYLHTFVLVHIRKDLSAFAQVGLLAHLRTSSVPINTLTWLWVGLMLYHCVRRKPNIKTALCRRFLFDRITTVIFIFKYST